MSKDFTIILKQNNSRRIAMRNAILFKSITKTHSDISKKYPHHIKEDGKSTVKKNCF